jgi:hypothetical protein
MKYPTPGCHPLHVASGQLAAVTETVAVAHGAREHVGDGFDTPMRVPRKSGQIVVGVLVTEVVEQEKRIEVTSVTKTKSATQSHTSAFNGGFGLNDSLDWSYRHGFFSRSGEGRGLTETLPAHRLNGNSQVTCVLACHELEGIAILPGAQSVNYRERPDSIHLARC